MACRCAACSIAPLLGNRNRNTSVRITIHSFVFPRWLANLRVREIEEIKSVPYAPVSHPFVERLIGTIRHELLDRAFFWNATVLARKLDEFRTYYNTQRVHRALDGIPPTCKPGNTQQFGAALAS